MLKIEILCECCNEQCIIITQDTDPEYCPFCQTMIALEDIDEDV